MLRSNFIMSRISGGVLLLLLCLFPAMHTVLGQSNSNSVPLYSPVVNGEALRGISTIGSAESMGAGRITFSFFAPWYRQKVGYRNTPNTGANVFTGVGAFSYGVNSYVDLFASVSGFGISNYTKTGTSSGLGTIRAGVQGSLPFPKRAMLRMGGQAAIIGGTSQSQINSYRSDGFNYFETRTGYNFSGKLMQTIRYGSEDLGIKFHLNETGIIGLNRNEASLLLLGAGLQANTGFMVFCAEINSRTKFNDMSFGTDPLWFTPSLHFRTPYHMNAMMGVDISLSTDRDDNLPRALEPYRVFGLVAFSFDMLAGKRKAALELKKLAAKEKIALEETAAKSAQQVQSLTVKSLSDSVTLAEERKNERARMNSMQRTADTLVTKVTADSLALIKSASVLAFEKSKRSEAENHLLSSGELLLDAVYFETGRTNITINSKSYLNIIGTMLMKYPKLQIEVSGHTDNIGSDSSNVTLSQGRAEAVRDYLIEFAPALNSRLNAHGYGMSMPQADNGTSEGRLTNRRVQLQVVNISALQEYR